MTDRQAKEKWMERRFVAVIESVEVVGLSSNISFTFKSHIALTEERQRKIREYVRERVRELSRKIAGELVDFT